MFRLPLVGFVVALAFSESFAGEGRHRIGVFGTIDGRFRQAIPYAFCFLPLRRIGGDATCGTISATVRKRSRRSAT